MTRQMPEKIFELLKGHVLAGNALPDIWIPDHQTRDDREIVRSRLDAGKKLAAVKTQVQTLLKRNHVQMIFPRKNGHAVKLRCVTHSAAQIDTDSDTLTVNAS